MQRAGLEEKSFGAGLYYFRYQ